MHAQTHPLLRPLLLPHTTRAPLLTVDGPVNAGGVQNSAGVGVMLFLPPGRTKACPRAR